MIKSFCLFAVLAGTATVASADMLTYSITVNTPNFGTPGWIDFSFNQANSLTSLSATATITNFHQTGYTLDTTTQFTTGVTGSLSALPVVIPNDQDAANYFTQGILSWGSSFGFDVTISGPAVGTAAADGSAFRVTLYDNDFGPLAMPELSRHPAAHSMAALQLLPPWPRCRSPPPPYCWLPVPAHSCWRFGDAPAPL
jgi:hypothetical protein